MIDSIPQQLEPLPGRRSGRKAWIAGLAAMLLLAIVLRFDGLSKREMWLDEVCTFYYVHHLDQWPVSGPDFWLEVYNVPYVGLLHLWTGLVGESAFGLRSLSAVFGCATVLALFAFGRAIGGPRVGLIAGFLAAVHPLLIHYSREARVYALWCLLITAALYALYRAACSDRRRWWIVYAAVVLLTTVTHYYTLFWIPGTIVAVILASDRRRFLARWLTTHVVAGLLLAPFLWFFVVPVLGRGSQGWLADMWSSYPPMLAIPRSIWAMLPSGGYPEYVGVVPRADDMLRENGLGLLAAWVRWGPALLCATLLALLWYSQSPSAEPQQGDREPNGANRTWAFLAASALATLLVPVAYSLVRSPAYIVARYDLFAFPAITLTLAMLIDRASAVAFGRRRGLACVVVTSVLCGTSLLTIGAARAVPASDETAKRAARLGKFTNENDLVVSLDGYRWFLTYEIEKQGIDARIVSFPPWHDQQIGWSQPEADLAQPERVASGVRQTLDQIAEQIRKGERVFLLGTGGTEDQLALDQRLIQALSTRGYRLVPLDMWLGLVRVEPP